jgi:flagellar assembly protein FliH
MSTSPDLRPRSVLPAAEAGAVAAAQFDLDFGGPLLPAAQFAEARSGAHAQGYAAGWAEGRQAAIEAARIAGVHAVLEGRVLAAEQADRLGSAIAAIVAAAAALEHRLAPTVSESGEAALVAAVTLTETLLGHELAVSASPGLAALRRAAAMAPIGRSVQVRLNPAEYAALTATEPAQRELEGRTVTLLPDPALGPGDAVADCDATRIDARLDAALQRVRAVLSGRSGA